MVILSPLQKILWICKWFLIQIYNDASCYSYFYCYKYFLASSLLDPRSVCMIHQLIHMYCYYPPQIAGCVWVLHLQYRIKNPFSDFVDVWLWSWYQFFSSLTYELLPLLIFYTFLFWDQFYQFWSCMFFRICKNFFIVYDYFYLKLVCFNLLIYSPTFISTLTWVSTAKS